MEHAPTEARRQERMRAQRLDSRTCDSPASSRICTNGPCCSFSYRGDGEEYGGISATFLVGELSTPPPPQMSAACHGKRCGCADANEAALTAMAAAEDVAQWAVELLTTTGFW
eukprot:GHVU01077220.1.p1 GENE.GHVU01077220.1~~GHVU01077220.1.p1  ORF type:complete len:113 (+),score=8.08 GHVU01077220.1:291-629(+)